MKTRYWILLWCFSLFYLHFQTLNHPCIFGMLNYVLRGNSSRVSHISVYIVSRGTDCSLFQSIFSRIEMVFPSRTKVRFAYSLEDIVSPPWGKLQASLLSTITKIMSPFGVMGRCLLPIFKDPSFLSLGFLSCNATHWLCYHLPGPTLHHPPENTGAGLGAWTFLWDVQAASCVIKSFVSDPKVSFFCHMKL